MPQSKHRGQDLRQLGPELLPWYIPGTGGPGRRRKLDCLIDRKCGEVDVVLGAVLDVTAEVSFELSRGDSVVVHRAGDGVVLLPVISKRL